MTVLLAVLGQVLKLMAVFVPVHQALIELVKKVTGARIRRYWEALVFIVYGRMPESLGPADYGQLKVALSSPPEGAGPLRAPPDQPGAGAAKSMAATKSKDEAPAEDMTATHQARDLARSKRQGTSLGLRAGLASPASRVPKELGVDLRKRWAAGSERQLIESFTLRAVGDEPATEISEADIENVVRIARLAAPVEVRRTVETLNSLTEGGVSDPDQAARALELIEPKGALTETIDGWITALTAQPPKSQPVAQMLAGWRRALIEENLPAELRVRVDLGNALKAAEFRYHSDINRWSTLLAVLEGALIGTLSLGMVIAADPEAGIPRALTVQGGHAFLIGLISFGFLLVLPRATKSLTDMILGLGERLKL